MRTVRRGRTRYFILEGLLLIAAWQRTLDSMDLQEEIADAVLPVRLYGVPGGGSRTDWPCTD